MTVRTANTDSLFSFSINVTSLISPICQVNAPGNVGKQLHSEHLRRLLLREYKANKSHITK